jgi:hypothetical protein
MAIAFATFWVKFGGRLARAESDARASMVEAAEATAFAKEATDKLVLLQTSFGYARGGGSTDCAIERLGDRLDRFVEAAARK